MTTNQERAAEVIEGYYPPCQTCRARATVGIPEVGECDECAKECQYIAQALADDDLLAPDLPTPDRHNHRGEPIWETEGHTTVSNTGPLPINLTGPFREGWSMHPIEARDIAYALLAAAAHATQEKK